MFFRLLFLLTIVPFLEIYFLIRLSGSIGWSNTLLVVFSTGLLGAWLLKKQGHSILSQIQASTGQNQLPSDALSKGFFTFVGGLLLLTPGILTDVFGLSLIFPLTQMFWRKYFVGQWSQAVKAGNIHVHTGFPGATRPGAAGPFRPHSGESQRFDATVIDIEAQSSETVDSEEN